jgi:hypothetical protein
MNPTQLATLRAAIAAAPPLSRTTNTATTWREEANALFPRLAYTDVDAHIEQARALCAANERTYCFGRGSIAADRLSNVLFETAMVLVGVVRGTTPPTAAAASRDQPITAPIVFNDAALLNMVDALERVANEVHTAVWVGCCAEVLRRKAAGYPDEDPHETDQIGGSSS